MTGTAILEYRNEVEVEHNLIRPLFTDILGYPANDLEWRPPVAMHLGREKTTKEADLLAKHHGQPVVTVDAKHPKEAVQAYIGQLDSYAFHLQTPYSMITNGRRFILRGYYSFNSRINVIDQSVDELARDGWQKVRNIISFDNVIAAIREPENPVTIPDRKRITDYRRFFRKIHNIIRDRDKLDPTAAFDQLSFLLFLKAAEEGLPKRSHAMPALTPERVREWEQIGQGTARKFVNEWFQAAMAGLFPDVFDDKPQIILASETLALVLYELRDFHVRNGDVDVKGRAFEEFLPSQLRGEGLGQYFTPRPVVNFMADLAGISIHDVVVDFACGSGGFLIKAFEQMQRGVEQLPAGTLQRMGTTRPELLEDIKNHQLFGIDAEPRAARTAKMNMLMWGDGKRVVRGNALDTKDMNGRPYEPAEYDERNQGSGCTLILANPPFGSREKNKDILRLYTLGSQYQNKTSEISQILFLEKGLKLLRPEGKMLIVLPQGLMSTQRNSRVRDFIHSQAEIRAIISLPTYTFVQSGVATVNACILYVQKFTRDKKELYDAKTRGKKIEEIRRLLRADLDFDYPIFMGIAEYLGYEPSGRMIVDKDEKTDLDLLLEDFVNQSEIRRPDIDIFEFATRYYGEKSFRRRDQTIRGTVKGLKTSFVVRLGEADERLDPPFYLLRYQAGALIESLAPIGNLVTPAGPRFRPTTEDELDREYPFVSISSDGKVTLAEYKKGETFGRSYRPKTVGHNDFVYNPMRVNIGSIGVVPKELDGHLTSPDYIVFRAPDINREFLLNLLRSPFYRMYIDVVTTGSIRDRLYLADLQNIRIPQVSAREQAVVSLMVHRTEEEMTDLLRQISEHNQKIIERIHGLVDTAGIYASEPGSDNLEKRFSTLAEQWLSETGLYSSIPRKVDHPAYQKIIAMGEPAIPLILRELRKRPAHWFAALRAIAKSPPTSEGADIARATAAWLKWGQERGYID
jgi:type I restriction enzyme M protein